MATLTDKQLKSQQKRVLKLVERWRKPLGLFLWRILVACEDGESVEASGDAEVTTYFSVVSNWRYCQAEITAWLPSIATLPDDLVEEYLVHELCHVLVNEMRPPDGQSEADRAHEERVVTQLAGAFVRTRRQGQKEGKAA
jgi:hypothetical protein